MARGPSPLAPPPYRLSRLYPYLRVCYAYGTLRLYPIVTLKSSGPTTRTIMRMRTINNKRKRSKAKGASCHNVDCQQLLCSLSAGRQFPSIPHPCYGISRPPSFGRYPAPGPAGRRLRCPSSQAAAGRRPPTAASPTAPGLPGLPRRPPACGKRQGVAGGHVPEASHQR